MQEIEDGQQAPSRAMDEIDHESSPRLLPAGGQSNSHAAALADWRGLYVE